MNHLADVIDKSSLSKGASVKADKGYKSNKNDKILENKGFTKLFENK